MLQLFTPIVYLFLLIIVGSGIGKIKIRGVSLGTAGVLGASLIFGMLGNLLGDINVGDKIVVFYESSHDQIYSFLSSVGSSIFIAVVGLEAGKEFFKSNTRKKLRAFFSGVITVMCGTICTFIICSLDNRFSHELLLGLFAGSMTSTPTLTAICDLSVNSNEAVAGYGISYCFGLISIVLFVGMLSRKHKSNVEFEIPESENCLTKGNDLVIVSITVLSGYFLKCLFPIGATGGILASAVLVGILISKSNIALQCDILRELGLMMFFIGSGVPAGAELIELFSPKLMVYGLSISLVAIFGGYFFSKKVLIMLELDTLSVLCGGMTSTPAIGILKKRDKTVDLSLYAVSYIGAIFALIFSVKILYWLI